MFKKYLIQIFLYLVIFLSISYYYNIKLQKIKIQNKRNIQYINNIIISKNDSLKVLINNNNTKINFLNNKNKQLFKLINQNKPVFQDTLSVQEMKEYMQQFIIRHNSLKR